ncbi:hypothetical protein [Streptomyces sp. NPDC001889]
MMTHSAAHDGIPFSFTQLHRLVFLLLPVLCMLVLTGAITPQQLAELLSEMTAALISALAPPLIVYVLAVPRSA